MYQTSVPLKSWLEISRRAQMNFVISSEILFYKVGTRIMERELSTGLNVFFESFPVATPVSEELYHQG